MSLWRLQFASCLSTLLLYLLSSLSISVYGLLQIAAPFVLGVGELPGNDKFAVWARKPSHNTFDALGGTTKVCDDFSHLIEFDALVGTNKFVTISLK